MIQIVSQVLAILTSVIFVFLGLFGIEPQGKPLDLEGYTLVWEDEFEAGKLNTANWTAGSGLRRGGYWDANQISAKDGNLIIKTSYKENGKYGAGFYTSSINSVKKWTRGYFETRCKCPYGSGLWSAFWMICDGMENVDGSGTDGAEIDIFEAPFSQSNIFTFRNKVESSIHYDGYGDDHESYLVARSPVTPDPYKNFNTYGVMWDETGYTFFINGKETAHSSFGGSSRVPEQMILSVEIGGENGIPGETWVGSGAPLSDKDFTAEFVIDYVRVYQIKK